MKRNHLEKAKVDVVEAPRQLGVEQASEHAMVCNARAKRTAGLEARKTLLRERE